MNARSCPKDQDDSVARCGFRAVIRVRICVRSSNAIPRPVPWAFATSRLLMTWLVSAASRRSLRRRCRRRRRALLVPFACNFRRRRRCRAAVAVGHAILVIAYHLLTEGTVYQDLGAQYFDERAQQATERRLVHRLEALGYKVALEPAA